MIYFSVIDTSMQAMTRLAVTGFVRICRGAQVKEGGRDLPLMAETLAILGLCGRFRPHGRWPLVEWGSKTRDIATMVSYVLPCFYSMRAPRAH